MKWSKYSEAIFDFYLTRNENFTVKACPGAGKTTNIRELWALDDKPSLYLVFNKHNKSEAIVKLSPKSNSSIDTLNGLGHKMVMSTFGRVQLDERKVYSIIKNNIRFDNRIAFERTQTLAKMVSTAKMLDINGSFSEEDMLNASDTYDLDVYDGMHSHVQKVLDINDNMKHVIDFNDQIRFAALYCARSTEYHNVLVDEAQDVSAIQALMIQKLQAERYGFVGDEHQSIYGFRGAMSNSMQYLEDTFNCKVLPLSITYRCAKLIVKEAFNIFPDIEAWEESPEGIVRKGYKLDEEMYDGNTIVLCRLNRPLIALAFELLKNNIPCHVRGRDIGQNLIKLIKSQQAIDVSDLITRLTLWRETELQKALARENESKIQSINDKYDSIMIFINKVKLTDSVDSVIANINTIFEQGKGVCLSTVHKAKGLEADKCIIVDTHLMPFPKAKKEWEIEQEKNIKYVAVTRAKKELVYG